MKRHWILLWSLWAARLVRQPTLPVQVTGGLLRGEVVADGSHARYLAIPYAVPPRRFQAPEPEPTWEGIFDAIEENVRCPQRMGTSIYVGQDDCLTLNIYTSLPASTTPLPVMVFIHGGGFFSGSSSNLLYGPEHLVKKGVILVTINYRLNILGYLCLRIKEAPGNAGLKDQVAALKWIQRNIRTFGGDPDNVTIFGESAGSASVSYHILSPMSKGLFHKAILQSGSSLSAWAMQYRPTYMASLLTSVMGYASQNPYEILNILNTKTTDELVITRVPRKEGHIIISELLYVPCVEDKIDGVEPFLTELPIDLLSKGEYNKVPIMIGSNNNEGLLLIAMENETMVSNIEFEKSIPKDLSIPTESEKLNVAKKLETYYMGGEKISMKSLASLSQHHGEVFMSYPIFEETQHYLDTNSNPVYSYLFNYKGLRNFPSFFTSSHISSNATHADELFYLFNQKITPLLFEHKMIDKMTMLWTNFAKYGDPTPKISDLLPRKWHPADRTSPESFVIDTEFSTFPLWATESVRFLRDVYSKYRRRKD